MKLFIILWPAVTILAATSPRSSEAQQVIPLSDATCPECEISLHTVVTLGSPNGPGMLESEYNGVKQDSRGRYAVYSFGSPYFWIFSSEGEVVQRVGRGGAGPGEFRGVSGIVIDPSDSLFVFDVILRRIAVFSPAYEPVRTVTLDYPVIGKGEFIGANMLINAGIHTPERIGYPLHLLQRNGRFLKSFGSTTDGLYRPDMREIIDDRQIAVADNGTIWAAAINQYVIERWDTAGRMIEAMQRKPRWFPTWWEPEGDSHTPPVPVTVAVNQQRDTLWVLIAVPSREWRSAVEQRGRRYVVTDRHRYRDTVVEAIDLRTRNVLASTRVSGELDAFVGPGLVSQNTTDRLGNPVVLIQRLQITHPN